MFSDDQACHYYHDDDEWWLYDYNYGGKDYEYDVTRSKFAARILPMRRVVEEERGWEQQASSEMTQLRVGVWSGQE